ncbi:MAG: class I SAM-dependent methyltransferase, partial [Planctomycetota bacterium]
EPIDSAKAEAFGERMVGVLNDAALALMGSIGHRTGLFDRMADMPPSTIAEIASAAGLNERYVREWLGAMVTGGVIEHDPDGETYWLPPEHAASLTRVAGADNVAQYMQWVSVIGGVECEVVDAFTHGQGVPYSAYRRFHEVMAEESALTVVGGLLDHIIPLAPALRERLAAGIDVLDVGCGAGRAMNHLAAHFPNSRFVGYDFSDEAIEMARKEATDKGFSNSRFEVQDAATFTDTNAFDLICTFDAVHDQAKPDALLRNIARALRPDGVYLMQDIQGTSSHHGDIGHPIAPFIYTISCMHCMSVSLAAGGPGLGAAWGKETALRMLADAGFTDVRVEELPHDFTNFYYIARL